MIGRIPDQLWFPFWVDKWLLGSMRIEFTPTERAIWVDLLALAAKDSGYIRANEETPYLRQQLAGLLVYDLEEFNAAVKKFVKKGKLIEEETGVLRIAKWEKYAIADSYRRVLKHRGAVHQEEENVTDETRSVTDETEGITSETQNVTQNKTKHIRDITTTTTTTIKGNKLRSKKKNKNDKLLTNGRKKTATGGKKKKITFNKETGRFENITEDVKRRWAEAYPAVDIDLITNGPSATG